MTDPSKPLNLDEGKALRAKIDVLPLEAIDSKDREISQIWGADGDLIAEVHGNLALETDQADMAAFLAWTANNFDAMHDELAAARKMIAELEGEIASVNIFAEEKENSITIHYRSGEKFLARSAIIPQAEDAPLILDILQGIEELREGKVLVLDEEVLCGWRKMLHRYLAAIEGGQP